MAHRFGSWGRFPDARPARTVRLSWRDPLPSQSLSDGSILPYGLGRSYGDVCLNDGGVILEARGLDRFIAYDRDSGVLRAEAGVSLGEVLSLTLPDGWFLPVTPGTKWVTLGGAVANDVHGKNHHVAGTFGRHVTRLELARSTGDRLELTPADPLFAATVAGLGLTGLITWVELRLQRVESDQIVAHHTPFRTLDEFFELSAGASARSPYVVAWLDVLRPEGRGVLMEGSHAPAGAGASLPASGTATAAARLSLPFDAPAGALSRTAVRAFNTAYFATHSRAGRRMSDYGPFFYPLDSVANWNRAYGPRGLLQHQSVVPEAGAVRELLRRVAASGAASFLSVLKTFGDLVSPGLMSFPRPGITLALDFAHRGERTIRLLRDLDAVVREAGGRVYPAKDACMTGANFRAFYPQWEALAEHADPAFSSSFWRRVMSD